MLSSIEVRPFGMQVLNAQPGDTVLVAGKGHESYQLVGDKKLDFSDVDCAAQALREREVAYA
jgi:UDP-N-acetylmuramoyl-L-alanyl-D-glutamate--2,6-diaminopimelate ligase